MLTEFSSWSGRNGIIHNYWHGNGSLLQTGCECGLNKSCTKILHETKCNCDSYLENMTDMGVLNSMEHLPVKKLNYGGAFSSSSSIQFSLSPLVCSGKSKPYSSENLDIMKEKIEMIINTNESQNALIEKNRKRASQSVVLFIARSPSLEPDQPYTTIYTTVIPTGTSDHRSTTSPGTTTSPGRSTTSDHRSTTSDHRPTTSDYRSPPSGYKNGEKS